MKIQLLLFSIYLIFSGCNERIVESKNHSNDTIIDIENKSLIYEKNFNLCYSDIIHENDAKREVGQIGMFKAQNIYYELWSIQSSNYLNAFYLFLRTDTNIIYNYDFCLPEIGSDTYADDNLVCKRLALNDSSMVIDTSLTIDKIPGFKQLLLTTSFGWQRLSRLNQDGNEDPKIYFKGDKLLLEYWDYDNSGNSWLIKETFNFIDPKFQLNTSDTIQKISSKINKE